MNSAGGKSGTNLSKQLPRGCFPEKADTRGKGGAAPQDKTDGDTGSKMPALEHDVDSREGVISCHKQAEPARVEQLLTRVSDPI